MKISCPTCAAKYSVADEKIQSRLAKIRCRKCSSTIVIDGTVSPASVYIGDGAAGASNPPADLTVPEAAPGSARFGGVGFTDPAPAASEPVGPAPDEYAVDIADNDQRNMTIHQIVGAYNEGLITADTYIWKEGMADWQTLAEVKEVANALHAAARTGGGNVATPAALRRDPSPAMDLFGGIDRAGGEDDITTSAPDASPAFTAGTGARNESSVLFSLSALTNAAEATSTSSNSGGGKRGRATNDDSGLIDLQALTSAEAAPGGFAPSPVSAYGASPLISAPLGGVSGPALGGPLGGAYGGRSSSGRLGLTIGAVLLGACIIGATLFVLKGTGDTEQTTALDPAASPAEGAAQHRRAAADPAAAAPDEPTNAEAKLTEADVPKAAVEQPAEAATPEPAATETAKPAPRATRPRPATKPKPQAAAPEPEPEPAPKPAATPRSEPASSGDEPAKKKKEKKACECKPADLLCAMRCSAKK